MTDRIDHTQLADGRDDYPTHEGLPSQLDPITERDWDILVCFDGCRVDAMEILLDHEGHGSAVVEAYRTPSNDSTRGWLHRVWNEATADWSDLTYVMANPVWKYVRIAHKEGVDDPDMTVIGEDTAWAGHDVTEHVGEFIDCTDEETVKARTGESSRYVGAVRPDLLTEVATQEEPPLVVHYFQPHAPFIGDIKLKADRTDPIVDELGKPGSTSLLAEQGHVSQELFRAAYMRNLRAVWQEAKQLREAFPDARIAYTADHGECLGPDEWHHGEADDPRNQAVPWVVSNDL